jgi:DNA-binding CsgD family transcriptional regulator
LDVREARVVEDCVWRLARVPARAPVAEVLEALRPCIPFAAGLFGIVRPWEPDAMVVSPVGLPSRVFESWIGTPPAHLAVALAPVFQSAAGGMWRDSQTVAPPLRERLVVIHELEKAHLGEGVGYKVMQRTTPGYGAEHFLLALILERGGAVPPHAADMLATLNPAIAAAVLRLDLPYLRGHSIQAQLDADRRRGFVWVSPSGSVIAVNSRAHDLVSRYREVLRVHAGRGMVSDFAVRTRACVGQSQTWRRDEDGASWQLQATTHELLKEPHDLREDMILVELEERPIPRSRADVLIEGARLAPKEKQIANFLAHSKLCSKQLGPKLGSSYRTVETHTTPIYRKLGVEGRIELLWLASQWWSPDGGNGEPGSKE